MARSCSPAEGRVHTDSFLDLNCILAPSPRLGLVAATKTLTSSEIAFWGMSGQSLKGVLRSIELKMMVPPAACQLLAKHVPGLPAADPEWTVVAAPRLLMDSTSSLSFPVILAATRYGPSPVTWRSSFGKLGRLGGATSGGGPSGLHRPGVCGDIETPAASPVRQAALSGPDFLCCEWFSCTLTSQ